MNLPSPLPTSGEVDRRLRIVSELRNLCLSLGEAGRQVGLHQSGQTSPPDTVDEPAPPVEDRPT